MKPWTRYHSWVKSLNRKQRIVLAAAEWTVIGCVMTGLFLWYRARPLPAPASLGKTIESPYFQIHTDLADQPAQLYTTFFNEFFQYFEREYFPIRQKKRLKVFLFGSTAAYRDYVEKKFKSYTPYGSYLGRRYNTIVVNLASGLGTATHELVHHFMATADLDYYADWISEGFPAFFEKFIGYIDKEGRLHISLGYFSNWRFPLTKDVIDQYTLDALFKTTNQNIARSFMLFLHRQGLLTKFMQTLYGEKGKADPVKALEAIYGADQGRIESDWKTWVKSQPIDADVNLVERSFVLPYPQWVQWRDQNRDTLIWDEQKQLFVAAQSGK